MFMSIVCECVMLLFFVSFLAKQCDHGYYSTGAVALKQSSPSSCIQKLKRKEKALILYAERTIEVWYESFEV